MKPVRRFTDREAREAAELAARCLEADLRVQLVYLFGSAANSKRPDVRDVDLAILTAPPLSLDEIVRLRADAVAAARLPIDLVSLNHTSVVLAKEVADTGRCLFARSPDIEVQFATRARSRYWDFKPFIETQWRLADERMRERRHGAPT